jgi:hypothetical protein
VYSSRSLARDEEAARGPVAVRVRLKGYRCFGFRTQRAWDYGRKQESFLREVPRALEARHIETAVQGETFAVNGDGPSSFRCDRVFLEAEISD